MESGEPYVIGRIQKALATDPRIHKQDVKVTICGGIIHLTGEASTEERRRLIELVVRETVPDTEIRNEVAVLEIAAPTHPEKISA
jgi:hypothetical protein